MTAFSGAVRVTAELLQLPDLDRLMQKGLRIFAMVFLEVALAWLICVWDTGVAGGAYIASGGFCYA